MNDPNATRAADTPPPACSAWIEVSKDDFFKAMNTDVHPQIQPGPYPYTTLWITPTRQTIGKSVGRMNGGCEVTAWYLPNAERLRSPASGDKQDALVGRKSQEERI